MFGTNNGLWHDIITNHCSQYPIPVKQCIQHVQYQVTVTVKSQLYVKTTTYI